MINQTILCLLLTIGWISTSVGQTMITYGEYNVIVRYTERNYCVSVIEIPKRTERKKIKKAYYLSPSDPFTETQIRPIEYLIDEGPKKRWVRSDTQGPSTFCLKEVDVTEVIEVINNNLIFRKEYLDNPSSYVVDTVNTYDLINIEEPKIDTIRSLCIDDPNYTRVVQEVNHKLIQLGYLPKNFKTNRNKIQENAFIKFMIDNKISFLPIQPINYNSSLDQLTDSSGQPLIDYFINLDALAALGFEEYEGITSVSTTIKKRK